MKNCSYILKGNSQSYTYLELVEEFQKKGILNEVEDILFSKSTSEIELDRIFEELNKLKQEGFIKEEKENSYDNGEPVITDENSISYLEFIDSPSFTYRGKPLIAKMSDLEYINSVITILMNDKENPKSREESEYIANKEVEKWKEIAEDAKQLHILISDFDFRKSLYDFELHLKGTKFEKVYAEIYNTLNASRAKSLARISTKCRNEKSRLIFNLNLKAELEGLDKNLFGHIDMITIDADGDLHLFNYKYTTTSIPANSAKLEKYKYLMALLRQILANHGFKVRNATLHIVPIKVTYNEDLSGVDHAIVNDPIELTKLKNGKYSFMHYDRVAQHFIKSVITANKVNSGDLSEATKQLQLIFPERNIRDTVMEMTTLEWIRKNRASIEDSTDPDYAYEIDFGEGDVVKIPKKYSTKPEYNLKIQEEIEKRLELLDTGSDIVMNKLIKAIRGGFSYGPGFFTNDPSFSKTSSYLSTIFSKYFPKSKESESDWELIENDLLTGIGIILFRHSKTKQVDVVSFSPYNLNVKVNFKRGGDTVLGCLFPTATSLNQSGVSSIINYKSTYGNIEAVRTMILLNQILPKIEGDVVLGKLHILSLLGSGQGVPFSLESLNKECFTNVVKVLNKMPNMQVVNNFTKYKFLDKFEVLLLEYNSVIEDTKTSTSSEKEELIETGFGNLATAVTIEAKLTALREIELAMRENYPGLDTRDIKSAIKNVDKKISILYERVVNAITYYEVGEISSVELKLSGIERNTFVSGYVPNRNFRIIVDFYTKTINTIAERAENKWIPIRELLFNYYNDVGYSRIQNSTIGGQARVFNDLYKRNSDGTLNQNLKLLNPYNENDMALIKNHRRVKQQFLKRILFEFAKIRYPMNGTTFNFTNENDPALQEFISKHSDTYFNIPLEKASKSTRLLNYSIRKKLAYAKQRAIDFLRNPKREIEERANEIFSEEEQELRNQSRQAMKLQNKFLIGEGNERENYIARQGVDFFETNLETLIADFIERDIETQEYNKALVVVKGVLFQLDLLGENPNQKEIVEQTEKMINDFVDINIFRTSIMDETSLKIMGITAPFRRLVSDTLIGGNVVGAVRDTFEGVWQNTLRSLNHYQTNISKASLAKAYKTVITNSFSDGRSINIVNLLCLIYRLSNIDVSRISEGLKSERGAVNYKNWLYSTLRRPDFLNRMTLFVAKCYQDGVYEAFSIKDGKLHYDWRKDKRFRAFAKGDKNDKEYNDHMGAYYNAVRAYNLDHPDATIGYNDDLPMPYSFQEVEAMKRVANSIYGSYDKSTRAAYEHMALGTFFGMFSTWMNGIYTNYMMKPGQYYSGEFKLEQATDESGNLKFFDNDGNTVIQILDNSGNPKYFYEGTNEEVPAEKLTHMQQVMDKVPIVIQGIWYTLKDTVKILLSEEGSFKDDIWADPVLRANLRKLFSDLLAWLIFSLIYRWVLNPAYKEFKKTMPERSVITNAVVEVLYKGLSRSYDGFRGVYNVFEYLGENTNPPIYSLNMKLLKEVGSMAIGNRTFTDVLYGNVSVFRSFQDTYRAYKKSQEE